MPREQARNVTNVTQGWSVGRVRQQGLTSVQLDLQVGEIVGELLHELTHVPEATHGTIVCELGSFEARCHHRFPATADTFLL